MSSLRDSIAALTAWNNEIGTSTELRLLKIAEEYGEVSEAHLGYLGLNPRKGVTNGVEKVWLELADVVIAALVAIESLGGDPVSELGQRLAYVVNRVAAQGVGVDE